MASELTGALSQATGDTTKGQDAAKQHLIDVAKKQIEYQTESTVAAAIKKSGSDAAQLVR